MKRSKILVTLSIVFMVLSMCFVISSSTSRAKGPTYTYTNKDGETITLGTFYEDGVEILYLEGKYGKIGLQSGALTYGFDQYGTAWFITSEFSIVGWNYEIQYDDYIYSSVHLYDPNDPDYFVFDAESLVYDSNNQYVIGYKTFSGEIRPVLSYEEFCERTASNKKKPSPTPSTPTPTPVVPVNPTPSVAQTSAPADSPKPTVAPISTEVSIKKQGSYTCIYTGDKVVSKFKLSKKGVLTFKGKKTCKYKGVTYAGFIEKSKNLIFVTKKGQAYTVSSKGKKKTILKKGAKKLIFKGEYVVKIKKKSGYTNVTKR